MWEEGLGRGEDDRANIVVVLTATGFKGCGNLPFYGGGGEVILESEGHKYQRYLYLIYTTLLFEGNI